MTATLQFPNQMPDEYLQIDKEPVFNASKHLQLEPPKTVTSLKELGYSDEEIKVCPSAFGVSSAFRVLSDDGLAVMRDICLKMYDNRNVSAGTGKNRLGSYVRGAGYRSKFIKDFCDSPELAVHLSEMASTKLARHSVPAVACGVNYAPEDITKAVDTWHTDSVAFDIVMMLSDPATFSGGEFQYFEGTKMEGQSLLGIAGEEGKDAELPRDRITTIAFPAAGYGFMQQGNMIFHRATRLQQKAERITMVPSFVVVPPHAVDGTNSVNMAGWDDPGLPAELTRHEAWRAAARLEQLVETVSLQDSPNHLVNDIDKALAPLLAYRDRLAKDIN